MNLKSYLTRTKSTARRSWKVCVGLEVHAQIQSKTKLFSAAPVLGSTNQLPNSAVAFFDAALPGTLPRTNLAAVEQAVRLALALGCTIHSPSVFERKHYFYCDLPHGFQITQHKHPIASGGALQVFAPQLKTANEKGLLPVDVTRIQLEIDSGKTIHDISPSESFVDLNRAGTGLLEIVFEPCLNSADEVGNTIKSLQLLLRHLGVSDASMEDGNLRADLNVSVSEAESTVLGERVEVKNMNSIRAMMSATEYEAKRQAHVIEQGGVIERETRGYDVNQGKTFRLRGKEGIVDYRFFPEPDLPALYLPPGMKERVRAELSELPHESYLRLLEQYDISMIDVQNLLMTPGALSYFEQLVQEKQRDTKVALNWIFNNLMALLKESDKDFEDSPVTAERLGTLLDLISSSEISGNIGKKVLEVMFKEEPDSSALEIIQTRGWQNQTEDTELEDVCTKVVEDKANEKQLKKYKKGKGNMLKFFLGQVMKITQGKADPKIAETILLQILKDK